MHACAMPKVVGESWQRIFVWWRSRRCIPKGELPYHRPMVGPVRNEVFLKRRLHPAIEESSAEITRHSAARCIFHTFEIIKRDARVGRLVHVARRSRSVTK